MGVLTVHSSVDMRNVILDGRIEVALSPVDIREKLPAYITGTVISAAFRYQHPTT
ncbi:Uncharacterised protein [Serratia fonticola]|nr:Uncharacterised protein [Serratia fonticola]